MKFLGLLLSRFKFSWTPSDQRQKQPLPAWTHFPHRNSVSGVSWSVDIHLLFLHGASSIAEYFSRVRWYLVQMEAVGDKLLFGMWPASSLCTLCRVVCLRLQSRNSSNRGQTRRTSSRIRWLQNGKSWQVTFIWMIFVRLFTIWFSLLTMLTDLQQRGMVSSIGLCCPKNGRCWFYLEVLLTRVQWFTNGVSMSFYILIVLICMLLDW